MVALKGADNLELVCSWRKCRALLVGVLDLARHLRLHLENEGVSNCQWQGCTFEPETAEASSALLDRQVILQRHVSLHAHLTMTLAAGQKYAQKHNLLEALNRCRNSFPQLMDVARPVALDLSNTFRCQWNNCSQNFDCVMHFYTHVFQHTSQHVLCRCNWMDGGESCLYIGNKKDLLKHLASHLRYKSVACPACFSLFSDTTGLRLHLHKKFSLGSNDDNINSAKFACKQCGQVFLSHMLLRYHLRAHAHQVVCSICLSNFSCLSALKRHCIYRHSLQRNFMCKMCHPKAFFKTRWDLRRHIIENHVGTKLAGLKCRYNGCDFETTYHNRLLLHRRTVHKTPSPVFACHLCSKQFTTGSTLRYHLLSQRHFWHLDRNTRVKILCLGFREAWLMRDPTDGKFKCGIDESK